MRCAGSRGWSRLFGFDEGPEACESVVPLRGDAIEVCAQLKNGRGIERVEPLAAGGRTTDHSGALENAQVLGDGLAGEMRVAGELRNRLALPAA